MKSTVCDTVHHLCNFGTQSDHNLPRKHNFHFDISDFTVALKVGHGHQNCYEKTNSMEIIIMQSVTDYIS